MKADERYLVRIFFDHAKTKICVRDGAQEIHTFFNALFDEHPEASRITIRKMYNPRLSTSDIDDARTFIAKSRDSEIYRQDIDFQAEEEKVLQKGFKYPEEIQDLTI